MSTTSIGSANRERCRGTSVSEPRGPLVGRVALVTGGGGGIGGVDIGAVLEYLAGLQGSSPEMAETLRLIANMLSAKKLIEAVKASGGAPEEITLKLSNGVMLTQSFKVTPAVVK